MLKEKFLPHNLAKFSTREYLRYTYIFQPILLWITFSKVNPLTGLQTSSNKFLEWIPFHSVTFYFYGSNVIRTSRSKGNNSNYFMEK